MSILGRNYCNIILKAKPGQLHIQKISVLVTM